MSAFAYLAAVTLLKTPADLGNVIRQRRKALGWDQARLAHESGVSRQWIIDIEKGKPRAELQLVLRTANVLGLRLTASGPNADVEGVDIPAVDIDSILERHRLIPPAPAAAITTPHRSSGAAGTSYAQLLAQARERLGPTDVPNRQLHDTRGTYLVKPKKKKAP